MGCILLQDLSAVDYGIYLQFCTSLMSFVCNVALLLDYFHFVIYRRVVDVFLVLQGLLVLDSEDNN